MKYPTQSHYPICTVSLIIYCHIYPWPFFQGGYTVAKLVARCPLSTVNLEAIDSVSGKVARHYRCIFPILLQPWSQVYKVTVTLLEDENNSSHPFVLSVGPYVDSVSHGYHSSYGYE